MKVLVGLGNPGSEYESTRHNVGFRVTDAIARRHGARRGGRRARSRVGWIQLEGLEILVVRPLTYMNRSGAAVRAVLEWTRIVPENVLVVCDDLNLDFEAMRLRARGSHGGHNGLRSIIEVLGTQDFPRLRIGVGPPDPGIDHAEFVLSPFSAAERRLLPEVIERAADCVEVAMVRGLARAMDRFNRSKQSAASVLECDGDGRRG